MRNKVSGLALLVAIIVIVIGFRLASQAGQRGVVVQNDGYAGSGGVLILIGGIIAGIAIGIAYKSGKQ